jgi:hypothetical protein
MPTIDFDPARYPLSVGWEWRQMVGERAGLWAAVHVCTSGLGLGRMGRMDFDAVVAMSPVDSIEAEGLNAVTIPGSVILTVLRAAREAGL